MNSTKTMILFVGLLLSLVSCRDTRSGDRVTSKDLSGVTVGDQTWAARNLNVSTFRNGDSILQVRSKEEWERAGKEHRPAWCYYDNKHDNGETYGRMYNWYAITDPRGLAPEGWHVATNEEWIALEDFLGIPQAGIRVKCERGWNANGHGDNSSNLCVLPGGYRGRDGRFSGAGEFIYLASSTEHKFEDATGSKMVLWGRGVQFESRGIMRCLLDKEFGLYVRCVKDKTS